MKDAYDVKCTKCGITGKRKIDGIGSPCRSCGKGTMRVTKAKRPKKEK